ncbi:hypothetical protein AB4Z34_03150 [Ensifer sp. 2YAB10]
MDKVVNQLNCGASAVWDDNGAMMAQKAKAPAGGAGAWQLFSL